MTDDVSPAGADDRADDRADDPLVGSILADRYRILRHLGEGAMGAVYLGEHLKIGRRDAIKVLRPSLVKDPDAIARFARGARNASGIHHPNVCTVFDFAEAGDDFWFLAMEFIDGEELQDLVEREAPLPLDRAVGITIQVARALSAAHRMGIVHRDLKPGNVMIHSDVDGRDVAKVVDFDIAKGSADGEAANVTRMGFTIGTPEYMSPEQLMVDPLDGRSDLYSLALVLFRMLTGQLPFRGTTSNELMLERLNQEPLTLADVSDREFPPGLQPLLDRALKRRPDDRHEDAVAFMSALEAAVSDGTEAAPRRTESPRPARTVAPTRVERAPEAAPADSAREGSAGRPAWLLPAAGVLVVGVVGALALSTLGGSPSDERLDAGLPTIESSGQAEADLGAETDLGTETDVERGGAEGGESAAAGGETTASDPVGGGGPPGGGDTRPPDPIEPGPSPAELASRLDRLSGDWGNGVIGDVALREGAMQVYESGEVADSLRAAAAFLVASSWIGTDQDSTCEWMRVAVRYDSETYEPRARAFQCQR